LQSSHRPHINKCDQ